MTFWTYCDGEIPNGWESDVGFPTHDKAVADSRQVTPMWETQIKLCHCTDGKMRWAVMTRLNVLWTPETDGAK